MARYLIDLPPELLSAIAAFLEPKDVYNFRLTSRAMQANSFDYFSRAFFETRKYTFNRRGLNAIYNLCESAFSHRVQRLEIKFDRWNHETLHAKLWTLAQRHKIKSVMHPLHCSNFVGPQWPTEEELNNIIAERSSRFDVETDERATIVEKRFDLQILHHAITHFSNLRTIVLYEQPSNHCFKGSCGLGVADVWPVLGEDIGGLMRMQLLERYHPFRRFLSVLPRTKSSGFKLRTLYAHISDWDYVHPPPISAASVLETLETLHLHFISRDVDIRSDHFGRGFHIPHSFGSSCESNPRQNWLNKFLRPLKRLKWLVICFHDDLLARVIAGHGESLYFPCLEKFWLHGCSFMDVRDESIHQQLTSFLLNHKKTLTSLGFRNLKLGHKRLMMEDPFTTKDLLQVLTKIENLEKVAFKGLAENANDNPVNFEQYEDGHPCSHRETTFCRTPDELRQTLNAMIRHYRTTRLSGRRAQMVVDCFPPESDELPLNN